MLNSRDIVEEQKEKLRIAEEAAVAEMKKEPMKDGVEIVEELEGKEDSKEDMEKDPIEEISDYLEDTFISAQTLDAFATSKMEQNEPEEEYQEPEFEL